MAAVRAMVLWGNGINCERETAHACHLGGADEVELVHFADLLTGEKCLDDYHLLCLPGGFLDGDDLGAAKAAANRFRYARVSTTGEPLRNQLDRFISQGKLVLGICNGFQLMVKLGLLPGLDGRYDLQSVTLTFNDSGRFEDRWVHLAVEAESPCVFTRGLKELYLPVRHGEGKFFCKDYHLLERLSVNHQIVLRYLDPSTKKPTQDYPWNPNGSWGAVAGICDPTGRLFGLMPHPEAYHHRTNHPRWTREELPEEGQGVVLFRNAVSFIRDNLL
ncbi:MAG: phosphoribosylformylglycinamidine synthase subunit PurQ [bacterium]